MREILYIKTPVLCHHSFCVNTWWVAGVVIVLLCYFSTIQVAIVKAMSTREPCVLLNLQNDGQSNVLELVLSNRIDADLGRLSVADYWQSVHNFENYRYRMGRNSSNCVAKSTDFACSHPDCTYHHKLESRFILHARSHLTFEVSPDAKNGTVMRFDRD